MRSLLKKATKKRLTSIFLRERVASINPGFLDGCATFREGVWRLAFCETETVDEKRETC
jgi:hypothetical protein